MQRDVRRRAEEDGGWKGLSALQMQFHGEIVV